MTASTINEESGPTTNGMNFNPNSKNQNMQNSILESYPLEQIPQTQHQTAHPSLLNLNQQSPNKRNSSYGNGQIPHTNMNNHNHNQHYSNVNSMKNSYIIDINNKDQWHLQHNMKNRLQT